MLALSSILFSLAAFFGVFALLAVNSDAMYLGRAGFVTFIVLAALMLAAGSWAHSYRHPLKAHYR